MALGDLISQVTASLDGLAGLWSSNASKQFVDMMNQWHGDVQGVQSVLEEAAKRVDNAGLGYSDLDTQIQHSFTV